MSNTPSAPSGASAAPKATATPAATPSTVAAPNTAPAIAKPAAQPSTSAQPPKMMKLKIDGKDVEMSEADVISYAQQGKVASQRFQEAAKMRKEAEDILKFAKENPKDFFAKTGMNARQWAEEYLLGELQQEAMSPEQKKARENEEKLKKFEDEKKQAAAKQKQEHEKRLMNSARQEFDELFTKALIESGLPRTEETIARMAKIQLLNVKNKYELSASQLAQAVRKDYLNEQKSLLGAFDGDQLIEFLGPDIVKKLTKSQIAKLKGKAPVAPTPVARGQKPGSSDETQGLSWRDYQRQNRKTR